MPELLLDPRRRISANPQKRMARNPPSRSGPERRPVTRSMSAAADFAR